MRESWEILSAVWRGWGEESGGKGEEGWDPELWESDDPRKI